MSAWRIEKLVAGGEGLARLADGRTGFAARTAVGDLVEPGKLETRKRWVRALDCVLVEKGPARVEPLCAFAARCGGCDWMHLALPAQREHKREIVAEALRRIGGFAELPPIELVAVGPELGYRRRLQLHVDPDGRIGLYGARSHEVVEIDRCLVADDAIGSALVKLREAAAAHRDAVCALAAIEIRSSPGAERVALSLFPRERGPAVEAGLRPFVESLARDAEVSVAGAREARAMQRLPLAEGVALHAPPGVFTQVNWSVNVRMIADLVAETARRGLGSVLDLYAGAGNFSLPLARAGHAVTAVERDPRAVRAARAASREAGITTARFRLADAAREAASLAREGERFDLVVLDPPREGAGETVGPAGHLATRAIAYVSCDPVTLARDLRRLSEGGLRLESLRAYDMFPQTHHVETIAWLGRASASSGSRQRV